MFNNYVYRWWGKYNMGSLRQGYSDIYMFTGLNAKQFKAMQLKFSTYLPKYFKFLTLT